MEYESSMVHTAQRVNSESSFSPSSRIVEALLFALAGSFSVLLKILKLERRVLLGKKFRSRPEAWKNFTKSLKLHVIEVKLNKLSSF